MMIILTRIADYAFFTFELVNSISAYDRFV